MFLDEGCRSYHLSCACVLYHYNVVSICTCLHAVKFVCEEETATFQHCSDHKAVRACVCVCVCACPCVHMCVCMHLCALMCMLGFVFIQFKQWLLYKRLSLVLPISNYILYSLLSCLIHTHAHIHMAWKVTLTFSINILHFFMLLVPESERVTIQAKCEMANCFFQAFHA